MFDSKTMPGSKISAIYHKRVTVELFFSAPHHTVIGLEVGPNRRIQPVLDPGRGQAPQNLEVIQQICQGIDAYLVQSEELFNRLDLDLSPAEIAAPPHRPRHDIPQSKNPGTYRRRPQLRRMGQFQEWGCGAFSVKPIYIHPWSFPSPSPNNLR